MNLHWLHLSDIHFCNKDAWRDERVRSELLTYLAQMFDSGEIARPDLVFCTGDIAFGETKTDALANQYQRAKDFFTRLLSVCGSKEQPLPITRLFVVPGNHDIDREEVDDDAQATLVSLAENSRASMSRINTRLETKPTPFVNAMKRLGAYEKFVKEFLPHQHDLEGRCHFAKILEINGIKVGIGGFNSAWSCAGPEDDRHLWLGAEWQFNRAQNELNKADIRIGLIHHPIDWLNETEREVSTRRIAKDFDFWLHGHAHNTWVEALSNHVRIGAGAVGAGTADEFGINVVKLTLLDARVGISGKQEVHLHQFRDGWAMHPIPGQAPRGIWPFSLPIRVQTWLDVRIDTGAQVLELKPAPPDLMETQAQESTLANELRPLGSLLERTRLFGREALLNQCSTMLQQKSILLLYGMRGNGKSALLDALDGLAPLAGMTRLRLQVMPDTSADDIFRALAWVLGEQAEYPRSPSGNAKAIAVELLRRYPRPTKPVYLHMDWAHLLLDGQGWRNPHVRQFLLGLQLAYGEQLPLVLELRERPAPGLFGSRANEVEVPGLDKASMSEMLATGAPPGVNWRYSGDELKRLYGWIGAGNGKTAHPLTLTLLIEVARGHGQSPKQVLEGHSVALEEKIEEKLLRDLFTNVLNENEQVMIETLALYRSHIPHDHAAWLEGKLQLGLAWAGLYRRCLLASDPRGHEFYLHSFISAWLRKRQGYAIHDDEGVDNTAFATHVEPMKQALVRRRQMAIAECWLQQLGQGKHRTQLNIERALEAFHHLIAAGAGQQIQDVAVEFLSGKLDWALKKIQGFYEHLRQTGAPVQEQSKALEYWLALDPQESKAWRFLGECHTKLDGWSSADALKCFEEACKLLPSYPHYWANLGRAMRDRGPESARVFLQRLEQVERDFPQAINDHVTAVRADCQKMTGNIEEGRKIRLQAIAAGSTNAAFYAEEAISLQLDGKLQAGIDILRKAKKFGCADAITCHIEANLLQAIGRGDEAQALRMAHIEEAGDNPAIYIDAANAMFELGDDQGALRLLEKAIARGVVNDATEKTRVKIMRNLVQ